jgi:hypothetical protein
MPYISQDGGNALPWTVEVVTLQPVPVHLTADFVSHAVDRDTCPARCEHSLLASLCTPVCVESDDTKLYGKASIRKVCGCGTTGISKALETSYTRVLAKQLQDQGIMVNACCPG